MIIDTITPAMRRADPDVYFTLEDEDQIRKELESIEEEALKYLRKSAIPNVMLTEIDNTDVSNDVFTFIYDTIYTHACVSGKSTSMLDFLDALYNQLLCQWIPFYDKQVIQNTQATKSILTQDGLATTDYPTLFDHVSGGSHCCLWLSSCMFDALSHKHEDTATIYRNPSSVDLIAQSHCGSFVFDRGTLILRTDKYRQYKVLDGMSAFLINMNAAVLHIQREPINFCYRDGQLTMTTCHKIKLMLDQRRCANLHEESNG
jgi:hypothetical protein